MEKTDVKVVLQMDSPIEGVEEPIVMSLRLPSYALADPLSAAHLVAQKFRDGEFSVWIDELGPTTRHEIKRSEKEA